MEYYIQGNADNADKIKAAFEKLGYETRVNGWNFNSDCGVYFTNEADKSVDYTSIETFVNLIKTHPDYKELELPVQPKFKVGDNIKTGNQIDTIAEIDNYTQRYYCESGRTISFTNQDLWKLDIKPHYDISNFHAGMPVLVRDNNAEEWRYTEFSHISSRFYENKFAAGCTYWCQCIPFDGNKHLLGTTDMCDEMYINW